jgi:hypothetical protein
MIYRHPQCWSRPAATPTAPGGSSGTLAAFKVTPTEVVTDAAAVYPGVLDELIPSAWHHVEPYVLGRTGPAEQGQPFGDAAEHEVEQA